jgi:transcription initiation factor IIF auxiliary subunit
MKKAIQQKILLFLTLLFVSFVANLFVYDHGYTIIPDVRQGQNEGVSGGHLLDPEELVKIPNWNPPETVERLYSSSPVKDLRYNQNGERMFPEVGRQGMNDCTAWASAYYLKTYLEAVDNNWTPDRSSRIFSPSFVYNQINGGQDRGSSVVNALKLMNQVGASTLKTMPYTKNYTAKPTKAAFSEAKKYKISSYYSLKSLSEIKQALQHGHPILIGIVTDSTFNSGRYKIYNKEMRKNARDRLGSSHGRHAMVITGYDDTRQALLLLNSWGATWGEDGYCWVSYDVIGKIGYNQNGDNFLEVALVAIDEKNNEDTTPQEKEVSLKGSTWFVGLDSDGKSIWGWQGNLVANNSTRREISKIQWNIPNEIRSGKIAALSFDVSGVSSSIGTKRIQCKLTFTDGKNRLLNYDLDFKDIKRDALKLVQTDRYYGKINGKNYWDWSIRIDGSLTDLNDIQKVIYHLHPTFKNPNLEIFATPENGFVYTTRGWGTFPVGATVYFKDGTTKKFSHQLQFRDKEKPNLKLTNTSVPLESKDGYTYYNWTAYIEGSEGSTSQISKVRYILHPTFKKNTIDITEGSTYGFPFSAIGWGTFEIKAIVYFKNGTQETLTHHLVFDK